MQDVQFNSFRCAHTQVGWVKCMHACMCMYIVCVVFTRTWDGHILYTRICTTCTICMYIHVHAYNHVCVHVYNRVYICDRVFLYDKRSKSYEVLNAINLETAVMRNRQNKICTIFPYTASISRIRKMTYFWSKASVSPDGVVPASETKSCTMYQGRWGT